MTLTTIYLLLPAHFGLLYSLLVICMFSLVYIRCFGAVVESKYAHLLKYLHFNLMLLLTSTPIHLIGTYWTFTHLL